LSPAESVLNTKSAVQKKNGDYYPFVRARLLLIKITRADCVSATESWTYDKNFSTYYHPQKHQHSSCLQSFQEISKLYFRFVVEKLWRKKTCWYFVNSKLSFGRYRCSASRTYYKSSVTWIAKVRTLNITTQI